VGSIWADRRNFAEQQKEARRRRAEGATLAELARSNPRPITQ
jgi:hypothetical protein